MASFLSWIMIWLLAFEKKPFWFWQEIWIQVVVILLQLYRCTSIQTWNWLYLIFFSQLPSTREVGNQAAWSLSSCKPGFGVEQIRDDNYETYWQSDGQLPHLVNIQFKRKTTVSAVAIYTDFRWDPYFITIVYLICFNYINN